MQINPKCIEKICANFICVSQKCCGKNPFICFRCENKLCQQQHKNCPKIIKWNAFKDQLNHKLMNNNTQFISISKSIQNSFQQCQKQLQIQLDQFYIWTSKLGIPIQAIKLLENINQNKEMDWTGKQISEIFAQIYREDVIKINTDTINVSISKISQINMDMIQIFRDIRHFIQEQIRHVQIKMYSVLLSRKQKSLQNLIKEMDKINEFTTHLQIKVNYRIIQCRYSIISSCNFIIQIVYHKLYFQLQEKELYLRDIQMETEQKNQTAKNLINHKQLDYLHQLQQFHKLQKQSIIHNEAQQKKGKIIQSKYKGSDQDDVYQLFQKISLNVMIIIYLVQQMIDQGVNPFLKQLQRVALCFLRNQYLETLRFITFYYPGTMGTHESKIKFEQGLSQALSCLPKLKQFTIVADTIKSKDGFKGLGKKFQTQIKEGWRMHQKW